MVFLYLYFITKTLTLEKLNICNLYSEEDVKNLDSELKSTIKHSQKPQ